MLCIIFQFPQNFPKSPSLDFSAVAVAQKLCVHCQKVEVQTHINPPPQPFASSTRQLEHEHVDIVGPLPVCRGFTHVLTLARSSTFGMKTETGILAFISGWSPVSVCRRC